MNSESFDQPIEQSFAVSYQSGTTHNRDLAGQGKLVIRPDAFVFHGRARGALTSSAQIELVLKPDQIWNVVRRGSAVQFQTDAGKSGAKQKPFLFFCETEIDAETVLTLLPAKKDTAFTEGREFYAKLQQLPLAKGAASVTNILIGANVVVFVIMGLLGAGWLETASMDPYIRYVANNGAITTSGEWWRLVTCMFAHYGLLHLALNMWALFQVGHFVERLFGRVIYLLGYLGSGIIGSLATLIWHGDKVMSAGASGAVFGVYGLLLGYLVREKHGMPRSVLQPMMKSTLTFAGYNLVFGAVYPQIDNAAHIGGLLGGALLGWIGALPLDRELRRQRFAPRLGQGVVAAIAAIAIGMAVAPRFDFNAKDQWLLATETQKLSAEEKLLDDEKAFAAYESNPADPALLNWINSRAVPFYEHAIAELKQLPLHQHYASAKDRDQAVNELQKVVESYRRLATRVAKGDSDAIRLFKEEQAKATSAPAEH
jgi:rhomboid protease GluP